MAKIIGIQSDIGILLEIAESIREKSVINGLNELSEKLDKEHFYLVIVGLFKRGKSSLINALIGEELAPVAVTPLTSVITFFEYGPVSSVEVVFLNNSRSTIELADIADFVSEEKNPNNTKQVQYLKIYSPASILQNITLVDTPGLGSLLDHNSDTTLSFLPRIDAALFVLSADIPVSKADEEFLIQINDSISNVLFVLNKSDLLPNGELDKIIAYNLKMLNQIFPKKEGEIELIPVSAREFFVKNGLNKMMAENIGNIGLLKHRIKDRIIGKKDKILISNSIKRLHVFADQLLALLTVKSNTLQLPIAELESKRTAMQTSINYLASGKDDFEAIIENRVKQLKAEVTATTEKERVALINHCRELLVDKANQTWCRIIETDTDIFYHELSGYIIQQFDGLKVSLEKSVKEEFGSILLQYSQQSQSFLNEIVKQMKEILGIDIDGIIAVFDLDVYTYFYLLEEAKYSIPSLKKRSIYKMMPKLWVKHLVLKQLLFNCMELINPNAGRIRSNVDYKISESFRKFKYHFNQNLFDLLQSLKNMIEESIQTKSSIHENIQDTLENLHREQEKIEEIKQHYFKLNEVNFNQ
jgi:ribosome biogenesis GTPase A